jgi:WD40 repeat protein
MDRSPKANFPEPRKELEIRSISYPLAFSPEGKQLAGSSAKTPLGVTVVDISRDKKLWDLRLGEVPAGCVAYSPDGKLLAWGFSGSSEMTFQGFSAPNNPKDLLLLTDSKTGKVLRRLKGHREPVNRVVFSPDGKVLASASSDRRVLLWNAATGKLLRTLAHSGPVRDIAFSPDGKQLVSAETSIDLIARLWDVTTGDVRETFKSPRDVTLDQVAFHPAGALVAIDECLNNDDLIYLWDLKDPTKVASLSGQTMGINRLLFHPNGKHLFSLDGSGVVFIWDIATRECLFRLKHEYPVHDMALSADGNRLAVQQGEGTGVTVVWSLELNGK